MVWLATCAGTGLAVHLEAVGALRVAVFRDWPYLYEGDAASEARYLGVYAQTPGAAVVIARDGETVVGASTCVPLAAEGHGVRDPFERAGMDPGDVMYFGESVLLPAYRGRGIGVAFFERREAHARAFQARIMAFCSVRREAGDPRRPADAASLDAFWRKRGFAPARFACAMAWREVGGDAEVPHTLDVWTKAL